MAKTPTVWATKSGLDSITTISTSLLLLEDGVSFLLLEDGVSFLVLEDAVVTPKESTAWSTPTKNATDWEAPDGYTSFSTANSGVARTTEASVARITEDGVARVLEDATPTVKAPTIWDNL